MDSDDISIIDRCEKQLLAFSEDPELDLVGGQVLEFCDEETNNIGERLVPEDDEQIKSLLQSRCPFNHPTVMYKNQALSKQGIMKKYILSRIIIYGAKWHYGNANFVT